MKNKHNITRRDFLVKSLTAMSIIYVIPDIFPKTMASNKPLNVEVSAQTKWAMSIDVDKCAKNCTACVDACIQENGLYGFDRPDTDPQWIRKITVQDIKTDKKETRFVKESVE